MGHKEITNDLSFFVELAFLIAACFKSIVESRKKVWLLDYDSPGLFAMSPNTAIVQKRDTPNSPFF